MGVIVVATTTTMRRIAFLVGLLIVGLEINRRTMDGIDFRMIDQIIHVASTNSRRELQLANETDPPNNNSTTSTRRRLLLRKDYDDLMLLSTSSIKEDQHPEQQSMIASLTTHDNVLGVVVDRVQHPNKATTTSSTLPTFPESSCPEVNPCLCVMDKMGHTVEELHTCHEYQELPLIRPNCTEKHDGYDDGQYDIVPRIYHSVGKNSQQDYHQIATTFANPTFQRNHHSDQSALTYIYEMCGEDIAKAYTCFVAPAYRADIFRFCALYAEGGVYLDSDLVPVVPLEELYSPCSHATIGHDFPWYGMPGKQMK